jgi:hypothetical protein
MKKMFNEGNQIHNLISSSGSGTVINYGSGSDFLTSYGSGYGSGSGSSCQKVTVPTVPVPVPQHCFFYIGCFTIVADPNYFDDVGVRCGSGSGSEHYIHFDAYTDPTNHFLTGWNP